MAIQQEIGNKGEQIAQEYLIQHGYQITETNWRYKRAEVDIIAEKGEVIVFVEVKTRSYDYYGTPDTFVDNKKIDLLSTAAHEYVALIDHEGEIRFDIISILLSESDDPRISHIEDAFFKGL